MSDEEQNKIEKLGDQDPLAPGQTAGDPTEIFDQIKENYDQREAEPEQPEAEPQPVESETAEQTTGEKKKKQPWANLSDEEKISAIQQLDQRFQKTKKELEKVKTQQQPRDDRGRFVAQDRDETAEALGKLLQNKPELFRQMLSEQQPQSNEVELDPDDVDPFRFFDEGSQENKWLQQQVTKLANQQASQQVQQAIQPLMDRLTLQEMRERAEKEFGIPEDRVNDFLNFLQQPKNEILSDAQTVAQLYKIQAGVSEPTNPSDTSDETDLPFDIEELRKMIDTKQEQTSPAAQEQNAGSEYADPRDQFMDQIIQASKGGQVI